MTPLLCVPRKQTQDVDFASALKLIIAQVYGEQPSTYAEEYAALNRCRQDALRGSAGSDTTARDLLYKYFGQLELLELRFPELRVPFPWADALTSKQISQLSLAYEKASVLFNIAATLSSLASSQNRASPEGLKRSFTYFKQSAGMFTYINDNFLHAPSTDLSKEVVKVLIALMLGQATEVFIERMSEDKKGAALKAKVCNQVASIYHSMETEVREFATKGWFPRTWSLLVQCKAAYFTSMAQYQRSIADNNSAKYGDGLGRLEIALESAKDAQRLAMNFHAIFAPATNPTLPSDAVTILNDLTKNHLATVQQALTTATKENDLIYHSQPTSEATLPVIEKTSVADPIPIQEVYGNPDVQKLVGQDIFIKLIPLSVHESASMYSEEKAKLVRSESENCEVADGEVVTALEYLGLPGSLTRFRNIATGRNTDMNTSSEPPTQIRNCAREIQIQERSSRTQDMITNLTTLKNRCTQELDYANNELNADERECEQARNTCADSDSPFDQAPSASIPEFKALRNDVKDRKAAVSSAATADSHVTTLWQSCAADVEILAQSSGEKLNSLFADMARSSDSSARSTQDLLGEGDLSGQEMEKQEMAKRVTTIEGLVDRLYSLKKERAEVLKDLKERTQADDISHLLILNRKSQNIEPTLFAAELEKFRAHQSRIGATIHHQQSTLSELQTEYRALTDGKAAREIQSKWSEAERGRKDLETRFQKAFDNYGDVRAGLSKGLGFYQDLLELANGIKTRTSRLVSSRKAERAQAISAAELSKKLNTSSLDSSFAGLNLSSSQSRPAPPPLPRTTPSLPPPPLNNSPYSQSAHSPYAAPPNPQSAYSYPSTNPAHHPYTSAAPSQSYSTSQSPFPRPQSYDQNAFPPRQGQPTSQPSVAPPTNSPYAPPRQPSYPTPGPSQTYSDYQKPPAQAFSAYVPPPQANAPSPISNLPPPPVPLQYTSSGYGSHAATSPAPMQPQRPPSGSYPSYNSYSQQMPTSASPAQNYHQPAYVLQQSAPPNGYQQPNYGQPSPASYQPQRPASQQQPMYPQPSNQWQQPHQPSYASPQQQQPAQQYGQPPTQNRYY